MKYLLLAMSLLVFNLYLSRTAYSQESVNSQSNPSEIAANRPMRAFLTIQKYMLEKSGTQKTGSDVSGVQLEITFRNGSKVTLPESGEFPISEGQVQEINRTFEIPNEFIVNDTTYLQIQILRSQAKVNPCKFEIAQISQYNRTYACGSDLGMQSKLSFSPEKTTKESVSIRVFTDRNSPAKEIPSHALAVSK